MYLLSEWWWRVLSWEAWGAEESRQGPPLLLVAEGTGQAHIPCVRGTPGQEAWPMVGLGGWVVLPRGLVQVGGSFFLEGEAGGM